MAVAAALGAMVDLKWQPHLSSHEMTVNVGDTVNFAWKGLLGAKHNVAETTQAGMENCDRDAATLISESVNEGSHSITYTEAGEHFYICITFLHCQLDQYIKIIVSDGSTPSSPAPSPSSSPSPASSPDSPNGDEDDPGDGKQDEPCFPSSAKVTLAGGETVRIDEIKPGDAIVAATVHGTLTTSVLSALSIAKPEEEASFITLTTDANASVTLTPDHHLPVGTTCCSTLSRAKSVAAGDIVWTQQSAEGAATAARVVRTTLAIERGLHSPVLVDGAFPVVDGLVTSFDRIESVLLASYLLPLAEPMVQAYVTRFSSAPAEPAPPSPAPAPTCMRA